MRFFIDTANVEEIRKRPKWVYLWRHDESFPVAEGGEMIFLR